MVQPGSRLKGGSEIHLGIYNGLELDQAINEAVENPIADGWVIVTGTTDKSVQRRLIFDAITNTFDGTHPNRPNIQSGGTRFREIHSNEGAGWVHIASNGTFPAYEFSIQKIVTPSTFTYSFPSKYGTFTLDYTITNGIPSISAFEAENIFNNWLSEQETLPTPEPEVPIVPEEEALETFDIVEYSLVDNIHGKSVHQALRYNVSQSYLNDLDSSNVMWKLQGQGYTNQEVYDFYNYVLPPQPPEDEDYVSTQCVDVYRLSNGSVMATRETVDYQTMADYVNVQKLLVRDCGRDVPTDQEVRDYYGYTPPTPTCPCGISDGECKECPPTTTANFGIAGILFAGVLALPILAGLGKWK